MTPFLSAIHPCLPFKLCSQSAERLGSTRLSHSPYRF